MTTATEQAGGTRRRPKPWLVKLHRILDILATGGGVWVTEPRPGGRK